MAALSFYVDGPLQSWGASSKFQYRETNGFPTKSGIVGLVAAAMGIDKQEPDEQEQLEPIVGLRLTVVKLEHPQVPVTRIQDFHTVGGGYPDTVQGKMNIPPIAGRTKSGGLKWKEPDKRTVPTHRSYLTDATFAVILEGDRELLNKVEAALLDPVWGVWFGRKACLPATPLSPRIGESRQDVLDALLTLLPNQSPQALESFEFQEELEEGIFYQSDQPVAFGLHHGAVPLAYRARGIRHHRPSSENRS